MKAFRILLQSLLVLALAAGAAVAQDKAKKQAEVQASATKALDKFYKARPGLKSEVANAPGYAVFTTYGLSFLVGGSGGSGLVHDNKTKKNTYMNMAQASAGLQLGASETEHLIIFKNAKAMQQFVEKGWELGAGGGAAAGAGSKSAGGGGGENVISDAVFYTHTKNGFEAGGAVAGTKFWRDKELN
jgi:lipid-binding SYLF domain-containing protein